MIDMRTIYYKKDFQEALVIFTDKLNKECKDNNNCTWSIFKQSFLNFTKNKCPICEDTINKWDDTDHYRPKDKTKYPFLECCYQNYMIMCTACNREYKKTEFPLYDGFKAKNIKDIAKEKPLLINPTHNNIFELFELNFIISDKTNRKILIIQAKENLSDYQQKQAEKTIEVYGIGNCDENNKIDNCRIEVLELHYEKFLKLAKLFREYYKDEKNKRNKVKLRKLLDEQPKLKYYGFYEFIKRKQFKINTI